jgi:hypothetical protein
LALLADPNAAPAAPVAAAPAAEPAPAGEQQTPEQIAAAEAAKAAEQPALKMPGKDAKPEEWAEFYKQVGVPEKAEAYDVQLVEGEPPEMAGMVQKMFKEANILPDQAAKLLEFRNKIAAEANAASAKAEADRITALDAKNKAEAADLANEWGQSTDAIPEFAKRATRQFLPGDKAVETINALESVLGYKETIKFLHGIGKGLGEGDAAGLGNSAEGKPQKTLAERMYPGQQA